MLLAILEFSNAQLHNPMATIVNTLTTIEPYPLFGDPTFVTSFRCATERTNGNLLLYDKELNSERCRLVELDITAKTLTELVGQEILPTDITAIHLPSSETELWMVDSTFHIKKYVFATGVITTIGLLENPTAPISKFLLDKSTVSDEYPSYFTFGFTGELFKILIDNGVFLDIPTVRPAKGLIIDMDIDNQGNQYFSWGLDVGVPVQIIKYPKDKLGLGEFLGLYHSDLQQTGLPVPAYSAKVANITDHGVTGDGDILYYFSANDGVTSERLRAIQGGLLKELSDVVYSNMRMHVGKNANYVFGFGTVRAQLFTVS